jgi:hypothetical protein
MAAFNKQGFVLSELSLIQAPASAMLLKTCSVRLTTFFLPHDLHSKN